MQKQENQEIPILKLLNMPNKNGIEAMLDIKAYEKENDLVMTPIIALTANALEVDKQRFKKIGMDGFIAKPIEIKALETELRKYLIEETLF